jgi:hypothetical protein
MLRLAASWPLRFDRWVTKPVLIFAGSDPKTFRAQHEAPMSESDKNRSLSVKQFNIRLPDDLHRELNAKCALDGLSLVLARNWFALTWQTR